MRYVSLSTDSRPNYAIHAPVAARLWLRLGYRTIVHIHESGNWGTEFGQIVLNELAAIGAAIVRVPVCPPLSLPNTMRAVRLVAAWVNGLNLDDFVMQADVDMYPLNREFFSNPAEFTVLRALYAGWLGCKTPPPMVDWANVKPGWRFQMCYAGARVDIWRELWNLPLGDSAAALRTLLEGTPYDAADFDEAKLSYAFLASPRAQGEWVHLDHRGVWRKGELVFVDPMGAPLLSKYHNMPRGLVGPEDENHAGNPEAIDLIPPRFAREDRPYWPFGVVKQRWPEEREWLTGYQERIDRAMASFPW
jgi:hypothetical protein